MSDHPVIDDPIIRSSDYRIPDLPFALSLAELHLTDLRNYKSFRLEVGESPVILTGPNGIGKTNILEAISFLAPGRGMRSARIGTIGRKNAGEETRPWTIASQLRTPNGIIRIGTGKD